MEYEYQVALSFAGEDRNNAEKLAEILINKRIKVFYDLYEQADLWGKDLYQHLQTVYRDKALFTVVFISEAYAKKLWTRHELEQMQARAFEENREYILPLKIDDTIIPGINKTTGYIDLRSTTLEEVGELLEKKLTKLTNISENKTASLTTTTSDNTSTEDTLHKDVSEYSASVLRDLLASNRFDEEELKDICLDLVGQEPVYEGIINQRDKRAIARRLIEYLQSRVRLNDLVNYIKKTRPDILF
ncbi:TIR domain-containing protein [Dendronalium sp. ChiSLP03b]|uniref:TIR domain-containing protein n=1 Tax=Dendronalium sp. ChiSLP03b TaxID=3075381 RepID=UPI002AD47DB1|nr:TIR domain-containing protein [Dendronalium sp. ChiSLP03b]MDZ8203033.1 TIR domain-containing protein [Dendronalium sp. ChiSLP03b]